MTAPAKETVTQRVERIKREKAPWSIMDDIRRYSQNGFGAIPRDDLTVRFRAWGLYTQGDGGGTRGEEMPFFMMRVRTPNGLLTSKMVRTIADLSDSYARSSIDITNRQNFRLHWLRIEDVPTVWDQLGRVCWGSMGSCGDNRFLNGNPDFANLPRKFKLTITGCAHWCSYPEINDVGVTAVRRSDGVVGFHVRVGGGLSTRPHLAVLLPAFVLPHQVLDVATAAAGIFRDFDELRVNRTKARMKFLFINHGWTAEKFLAEVERRIGYTLAPAADEAPPEGHYRDHIGVHAQQQAGLNYVGFSVVSGRITREHLRRIAAPANQYGNGTLRLSATQNILVLNVPDAEVDSLVAAADAAGVSVGGSPFQQGTLSCTGRAYCKLAITETKLFSIRLAQDVEDRLPGFTEAVKLHVTGCPNACGQHWIADIGLPGVMSKQDSGEVEGFDFLVGGGLGASISVAHRVGYRAPADDVGDALERLFVRYQETRNANEIFRSWTTRMGDPVVKAILVNSATSATTTGVVS